MMARAVTADFRNNSSASTVSELAWFLKGAACHTSNPWACRGSLIKLSGQGFHNLLKH